MIAPVLRSWHSVTPIISIGSIAGFGLEVVGNILATSRSVILRKGPLYPSMVMLNSEEWRGATSNNSIHHSM